MNHDLKVALYVVAAICFAISTVTQPIPRISLVALGLLAWVLVPLIETA